MKGFIKNILFALLLPTLAMADNETSCSLNSDKNGCESYNGCEYITGGCTPCDTGTYNDGKTDDVTQCKSCTVGSYCPAGSTNPIPCPIGSTSNVGAGSIGKCYMTKGKTQFCDGSGANCIDFNTVFGDVTISYDATDE